MILRKDYRSADLKVALPRSIKLSGTSGTFSGYGSIFGNEDSYGEIVAPGAFTDSLAEIKANRSVVPILWQHNPSAPIGKWTELRQDDKGLYVEGELLVDDVAQAKEAQALMKAGIVSGLSIGFYVRSSSFDEKTGIRTLTAVDLVECSIVTFPANTSARVGQVKLRSRGDVENILHEAGVSRAAARKLAGGGWDALVDGEDLPPPAEDPALSILLRKLASATRDLKAY